MTRAQKNLERPVSFRRAAQKMALIRGAEGREGGWIYNQYGKPVAHGWDAYGRLLVAAGLIAQDADHDGGNGKWYIPVLFLSERDLRAAEIMFGTVGEAIAALVAS